MKVAVLSDLEIEDQINMPLVAGKSRKPSTSFLQEAADDTSLNENANATTNPLSQGPTSLGDGEPQGATGATNDLNLDTPSCSSEQSSAKKTRKSHFTNRKAPNINLAIDIVSINNQFNFGGEKGELKPEELESKLESDIMELATKCVQAMRRAKKHKPRTKFNQLLAQEMGVDDEDDEEQDMDDGHEGNADDDMGNETEENEEEAEEEQTQDDDADELETAIDEALKTRGALLAKNESEVEEQMQMALAEDTLKIRAASSDPQIDNVSDGAVNGDQFEHL